MCCRDRVVLLAPVPCHTLAPVPCPKPSQATRPIGTPQAAAAHRSQVHASVRAISFFPFRFFTSVMALGTYRHDHPGLPRIHPWDPRLHLGWWGAVPEGRVSTCSLCQVCLRLATLPLPFRAAAYVIVVRVIGACRPVRYGAVRYDTTTKGRQATSVDFRAQVNRNTRRPLDLRSPIYSRCRSSAWRGPSPR